MRKLGFAVAVGLSAIGSAQAADLPARTYTKAPVAMMDPATNWSGFYIGAHIGGAWSETTGTLVDATPPIASPLGTSASASGSGVIGGGQVGYNWQMAQWVFGIEGDISGADVKNNNRVFAVLPPYPPGSFTDQNLRVNFLATATGRIGYAWGQSLVYAKGGAAFMNGDYTGGQTVLGVGVFPVNSLSTTRTGWTLGAGFEQAFMGNWSWKIEYDFMHFGTDRDSFFAPTANGTTTLDLSTDVHVVKVGLNYRFNGPLVAKY